MIRFKKALQLLEERKFPEARQLLELLLSENPNDPDIQYNLGMLCTEMGELARAIDLLTKCSLSRPDFANVFVALGFATFQKGEYTAAKAHLVHALKLEPDNPYAHRNLGGVYGKQGNYTEAILHLKRAYELNPDDVHAAYGLGHSYLEAGEPDKADDYLKKVIEMGAPVHLVNLAKDDRTRIVAEWLHEHGSRPDATFYCLSALKLFEEKTAEAVRSISFEIAMLGRSGLDIHNPDRKYRLTSLPGEFTGLHLVCLMYVGFQKIDPSADIGMDLSKEYEAARKLFEVRRDASA